MSANRYPDWASVRLTAAAPADGPVAFCADVSAASVLGAYRRGIIPLGRDRFDKRGSRAEERMAAPGF